MYSPSEPPPNRTNPWLIGCLVSCGGCGMLLTFLVVIGSLGTSRTIKMESVTRTESTIPARHTLPAISAPIVHKVPDKVQAYLNKVAESIKEISSHMSDFAEANINVGADPNLINDNDWKMKQSVHLVVFTMSADALLKIQNVPASAKPLHSTLSKIAHNLKKMCAKYTYGVDHRNSKSLQQATELINSIGELGKQAKEEIDALKNK